MTDDASDAMRAGSEWLRRIPDLGDWPGFRADFRAWHRGGKLTDSVVDLFGDRSGPAKDWAPGSSLTAQASVLYKADGRYRLEWSTTGTAPGKTTIFDGRCEWTVRTGGFIGASTFARPPFLTLLEPFPTPGFEQSGPGEASAVDGREVRRVRWDRVPAGNGDDENCFDAFLPDAVERAIDDETGFTLSERSFRAGEYVSSLELRNLVRADDFGEADFAYSPPPGAKVVRLEVGEDGRASIDMPLSVKADAAKAIARAGFRYLRGRLR